MPSQQLLLKKTADLADKVKSIPAENQALVKQLSNDVKSLEEDNELLKAEMYRFKGMNEKSTQKIKGLEYKISTITKYFNDCLEENILEDAQTKHFQVLVNYLNRTGPTLQQDLSSLLGTDLYYSKKKDSDIQSTSSSQMMDYHFHNLDISHGQSSAYSSQTNFKSVKKERLFKTTEQMKQKCEELIERFEEAEEADRMKRLKDLENGRKSFIGGYTDRAHPSKIKLVEHYPLVTITESEIDRNDDTPVAAAKPISPETANSATTLLLKKTQLASPRLGPALQIPIVNPYPIITNDVVPKKSDKGFTSASSIELRQQGPTSSGMRQGFKSPPPKAHEQNRPPSKGFSSSIK